ncbi:hypothetical protein [Oceanobacillus chungangensis]|nr:hypothetical protein [Oceanobacillus chungangensis]
MFTPQSLSNIGVEPGDIGVFSYYIGVNMKYIGVFPNISVF